jgi:hypothetical protein
MGHLGEEPPDLLSGPLEGGGNENSRIWSFRLDTLRVPKLVPHPALQPGAEIVGDPSKGKRRFPRVRRAGIRPSGTEFRGFRAKAEGSNPRIRECQWTAKYFVRPPLGGLWPQIRGSPVAQTPVSKVAALPVDRAPERTPDRTSKSSTTKRTRTYIRKLKSRF